MGTYVNKKSFDLTGSGLEVRDVSNKFQTMQLTVVGLNSGSFTVEAKAEDGDIFETVTNGTVTDLSTVRTLIIDNTAIQQIRVSVSAGTAYTLKVKQTNFKDE